MFWCELFFFNINFIFHASVIVFVHLLISSPGGWWSRGGRWPCQWLSDITWYWSPSAMLSLLINRTQSFNSSSSDTERETTHWYHSNYRGYILGCARVYCHTIRTWQQCLRVSHKIWLAVIIDMVTQNHINCRNTIGKEYMSGILLKI